MKSFAQTELMRDGVIERAPCARSAKMTQEGAIWVINVTEDLRGSSHQRNFLAYFPGRQGRHVPLASEQFFRGAAVSGVPVVEPSVPGNRNQPF